MLPPIVTVVMSRLLYYDSIIYVPIVMHAIRQNTMLLPVLIIGLLALEPIVPVAIIWWDVIGIQSGKALTMERFHSPAGII
jgi:hypothetical protein